MCEKRVLHIINGMSDGGAETYIMNVYRTVVDLGIQFDFLLRDKGQKSFYLDEIKKLGGRVFYVSYFPTHAILNYIQTKQFLEHHEEYKIIEIHANALFYISPLLILKKLNRKVIVHSHSTRTRLPIMKPIHYVNREIISRMNIDRISCSKKAGIWMFRNEFKVVANAINLKRFYEVKDKKKYNEKFVFACVAKFMPVKNHKYLLELFREFHEKESSSILILIGDGPTRGEIEILANKLGISNSVEFCGSVSDPERIIANATCFLLPSYYEGIPLTLIEAQALNLHCVVSTNVDKECNITGLVDFVELKNKTEWLLKMHQIKKMDRNKLMNKLDNSGYNIDKNIEIYQKLYTKKEIKINELQ